MVGVTTDHQSVSAEKKKCSFASRENPWRFLSDKYKRQRGSVKLSLPYSSVQTFLQYSCQNLRRSNQRKAQSKQKGAVQQTKRRMVRTHLLKQMRKLHKRLPVRRAVNCRIFSRKRIEKTEQRSAALSSTIYNDTIDKNQYLYEVFLFLFRILQS